MTINNDPPKDDINPEKLVLMLAIAGRLDAISHSTEQTRKNILKFAKKLDTSHAAYYPYALLDGLSLSYSMFKYVYDVFLANQGFDSQHEVMSSPEGMAAIAVESVFIIGFSFLACHFNGNKSNLIKKFIAKAWPYARDVMKASKNSYKGLRSTLDIARVLSGQNMYVILVPLGLTLGVLAAANRLWMRSMRSKRKAQQDSNNKLSADDIRPLKKLTAEELDNYLKQVERQSPRLRVLALVSAAFGGLFDSTYLFMGILTLASLSATVLWPLMMFSVLYAICCVLTRVYEEHVYQQKLIKTALQCEINLFYKRIITFYGEFDDKAMTMKDIQHLSELFAQFEEKRKHLQSYSKSSYKMAALMGIKHGLYAYSVAASVMFVVGAILFLCATTFPPVLLIIAVSSGLVFLAGFMVHALLSNLWNNHKQQASTESRPYDDLKTLQNNLKERQNNLNLPCECLEEKLRDGLVFDPSPQFFFQEWFEVIRSFFSGLGKGQKSIDFTCNGLQEADEQGQYHDTPVMLGLMVVSSIVNSFTLALRALAKGFGGSPVDKTSDNPKTDEDEHENLMLTPPLQTSTATVQSTPLSKPTSWFCRFFKPTSSDVNDPVALTQDTPITVSQALV